MRFCSIASGSSGNCLYLGTEKTNVLIDVGISGKKIEQGLLELGVLVSALSGIFITHEHSDHIKGLAALTKKYNVPVYGTVETLNAVQKSSATGKIKEELFRYLEPGVPLTLRDITIEPFSISHDASNPINYTFAAEGKKIGLATDLGTYDAEIISKLNNADLLYLEANHDENMLLAGAYPYYLKQRILGKKGHLSNDLSAKLVCELLHDKLRYIILGHLSKENNYAELAYETVRCELLKHWDREGGLPIIHVAARDIPSEPMLI